MLGLQRPWDSQIEEHNPSLRHAWPILLACPGTAMNLTVFILGRTGFSVEAFIDPDDLGSERRDLRKDTWKLSSLNYLGEIHLPGMAGSCPLTIFHVSFGFISLFGKDYPLICLFLSTEVLVAILNGMKGMYAGALRKPRAWKSPFVLVCLQGHHQSPCSAALSLETFSGPVTGVLDFMTIKEQLSLSSSGSWVSY